MFLSKIYELLILINRCKLEDLILFVQIRKDYDWENDLNKILDLIGLQFKLKPTNFSKNLYNDLQSSIVVNGSIVSCESVYTKNLIQVVVSTKLVTFYYLKSIFLV